MLDIEIPNIQMERYSVMFGTVLQPAHPPVPQSLLVRRQGNTDRLKPLNELKRSQTAPGALSPNRAASDNSDLAVAEEKQDSQSTSSEILVPTPTTTGTIDIYADYCLTPLSISVGASLDYHCSSEDFRGETDLRPPQLLISKPPPSPASPASPTAQVSIARKMSVTRPRADSLRPMPIIRVGSGRVAGRKPRTPTLVEPLKRISQRVEVESV
ncbi:hypothetical protein H2199_002907 [Coniosporium tulheliwenetii]|uniref:Uncharacterized protein n=1 Tax=Coniosporium tulheliwenetii TaxID=3383036 RepID=A0ACC2ZEZ9_9PEZI|nr:hypothetical protein H2199_002907 [Cladosporium sp. JES 115]